MRSAPFTLLRAKSYHGLIPNLALLLGEDDPSSNHLKPIARLLFDNTKLQWNDKNSRAAADITDGDIKNSKRARDRSTETNCCRLCGGVKGNYALHIIYECSRFVSVRPPSLAQGLSLCMTQEDMKEWVTAVSHMQELTEN